MPKITCYCGESINLSQIPNPRGFKILSEPVLETLIASLTAACQNAKGAKDFENRALEILHTRSPGIAQAYECPSCGRLLVFADAAGEFADLSYHNEHWHPGVSLAVLISNKVGLP